MSVLILVIGLCLYEDFRFCLMTRTISLRSSRPKPELCRPKFSLAQQRPNILIALVSLHQTFKNKICYSFEVLVSFHQGSKKRDLLCIHLFRLLIPQRTGCDTHTSRLFRLAIASLLNERDMITQLPCLFCLIIAHITERDIIHTLY